MGRSDRVVSVAVFVLAACATDREMDQPAPEVREYQTGSHLPRRVRGDVKTIDPESIRESQRRSAGTPYKP